VHIHSFGVVWLARQSPAQPLPCAGCVTLGGTKLAPCHLRFHLLRAEGKGFAQMRLGLGGGDALGASRIARLTQPEDQVRAQFDRPLQGSFGVDLAALLAQQSCEIHPRGGKVRAQDQRATGSGFQLPSVFPCAPIQNRRQTRFRQLGRNATPACNAEAPLHSAHHGQRMTHAHGCGDQHRIAAERQI